MKKLSNNKKKNKRKKNYSTLPSRLVSDVSTTKACWGLRSQSGRDARWPPEYDRSLSFSFGHTCRRHKYPVLNYLLRVFHRCQQLPIFLFSYFPIFLFSYFLVFQL